MALHAPRRMACLGGAAHAGSLRSRRVAAGVGSRQVETGGCETDMDLQRHGATTARVEAEGLNASQEVTITAGGAAAQPASNAVPWTSSVGSKSMGTRAPPITITTTTVRFLLPFKTSWGQALKLTGSHPALGSWSVTDAVELHWAEGDVWTADVQLPTGVYEYKYALVDVNGEPIAWQSGGNAVLAIGLGEPHLDVHDTWGNVPGAEVHSAEGTTTRESKLHTWARDLLGMVMGTGMESTRAAQSTRETNAMKSEAARLRMELAMQQAAGREREAELLMLKQENARLTAEVAASRSELNGVFEEALALLDSCDSDSEGAAPPPTAPPPTAPHRIAPLPTAPLRPAPRRTRRLEALCAVTCQTVGMRSVKKDDVVDHAGGRLHVMQLSSRVQTGDRQTDRNRKWAEEKILRVWTPQGYSPEAAPEGGWPVLFFNDAQNMFECWLAHQGVSWRLGFAAADLIARSEVPPFVIVGIDNHGPMRSLNYLPYEPGSGVGAFREDAARDSDGVWLCTFNKEITESPRGRGGSRLSTDPRRTAFGGASFGGINALHVAMNYAHVFGSVLAESPSLWIAEGRMVEDLQKHT
ncbi:hypothetical protein FOA52_005102 [Chlamydomonas sp. UWO 241]|nr:hypothetical protein FOA52_005102 [Chlamydomonas sp. UWO 241]